MRKLKIQLLLFLTLVSLYTNLIAQDSLRKSPISFSGYAEIYYSYDFGNPENHERPSFFYSLNKHNEINLNIGYIKAKYDSDKIRGNFALMAGTYSQYNLAGEQGLLKNVYEANIGVKISKNKNLWIDAGVMNSHIGFESAISKNCWTLTRSISAENSPYYETGIKIGYTSPNNKVQLAAMYLNGWQRIQRISKNQTPAFGTQLTLNPNSKITFNWSTYIGNEQPDNNIKWRYFNNFYGQIQLFKKLGLIAGVDVGFEQTYRHSNTYSNWVTPVLIVRYSLTDKIFMAGRIENYTDKKGVIIPTASPNGFQTSGYSLNFDYFISDDLVFRIEGRGLKSKDQIFILDNKPSNQNYFITSSIALKF